MFCGCNKKKCDSQSCAVGKKKDGFSIGMDGYGDHCDPKPTAPFNVGPLKDVSKRSDVMDIPQDEMTLLHERPSYEDMAGDPGYAGSGMPEGDPVTQFGSRALTSNSPDMEFTMEGFGVGPNAWYTTGYEKRPYEANFLDREKNMSTMPFNDKFWQTTQEKRPNLDHKSYDVDPF